MPRNLALRYLARREHSCAELRKKLVARDFAIADIDRTLDQSIAENLQSDARFAESYVRYRKQAGLGPLRIQEELRERDVSDALIDACLNIASSEWSVLLIAVWQKKFSVAKRTSTSPKDWQQQFRFLSQRGYTADSIVKLLRDQNDTL